MSGSLRRVARAMALVIASSAVIGFPLASAAAERDYFPLIDLSFQRLEIGHQVALAKWDSGQAVEDKPREVTVISDGSQEAEREGLSRDFAARFFADQIEANKLVQYALLASWHAEGSAPQGERVSLSGTIRPQLDELQVELIRTLVETKTLRSSPDCATQLPKAISEYGELHKLDELNLIGLDRAMARVCGS
jgi:chorismate mutase